MGQGNGMGGQEDRGKRDKSINKNLLRNGRPGIQKFKEQNQRTSSQFNSQAIYIVISGTVYSENTPGSTLLVSFHTNKCLHFSVPAQHHLRQLTHGKSEIQITTGDQFLV